MSIRVNDVPLAPGGYDITSKKIMVHDLTASVNSSTFLMDITALFPSNNLADGNKGDITVSNTGASWVLNANVVSLPKLAQIGSKKLLGNSTSASANVQEIALSNRFLLSGNILDIVASSVVQNINVYNNGAFISTKSSLNFIPGANTSIVIVEDNINNKINITLTATPTNIVSNGDYGDIVVTNTGTSWTVKGSAITTFKLANNAVVFNKMQNIVAYSIMGNPSASSSTPSEITLAPSLAFNATVLKVVDDTTNQQVGVYFNNVLVSKRKSINFGLTNLSASITDDVANNRVNITMIGATGGGGGGSLSIYNNGTFIATQPNLNFLSNSSYSISAVNNTSNNSIEISFTDTTTISVFAEVIIGQSAATALGLIAGATTFVDANMIGKNIEIVRGNFNLPMIDPLNGDGFATKPLMSDTITFTEALNTGEYIKIKQFRK